MNFVEAMTAAQAGFDTWAAKPHNAKWAKMIYHTPFPNDLLVNIATEVAASTKAADAKAQGWDAIADDMEALQVFAQGRALGGGRLIPWAINTITLCEAAVAGAPDGWRDISTIPTDGRRVTARDRDGHLHEIRANPELDRTIYTHWRCASYPLKLVLALGMGATQS